MADRVSTIKRGTKETNVDLELNIDGSGKYEIKNNRLILTFTNGEQSELTFYMKKVGNDIMTGAVIISGVTYFLQ